LVSIFHRFGVVWGRQVGVIFGNFGDQVRPRSVQNASWKLINIKNVNFAPVLRFPIAERSWGAQGGVQNAPRSAQDGSKRLLKRNFFALENRLKFGLVLGPILVDFGLPKCPHLGSVRLRCGVWKLTFFWHVIVVTFWSPLRRPKRRQRGPKTSPRRPKRRPRGPKTPPRVPNEAPRSR
jgi:hypothetical protein